jgi:hypothetical protein
MPISHEAHEALSGRGRAPTVDEVLAAMHDSASDPVRPTVPLTKLRVSLLEALAGVARVLHAGERACWPLVRLGGDALSVAAARTPREW